MESYYFPYSDSADFARRYGAGYENWNFDDFLKENSTSHANDEAGTIAVAGAAGAGGEVAGPLEMGGDGSAGNQGKSRKIRKAKKGNKKQTSLAVTEKELVIIRPGYDMGTLAIFKAPQTEGDRKRNAKSDHRIIGLDPAEKGRLRALRRKFEVRAVRIEEGANEADGGEEDGDEE